MVTTRQSRLNPLTLLLAAVLLLVAGCQSVDDRIQEKPDVFAQLDRLTQDKIKQGIIDLGYTQDMVYLALGNPDEKRAKYDANERSATWVYNTYYERYNGTSFMGYYRQVYYDPYVKTYRVYYRPAYADTYVQEKEERIRVVFNDGRVTAIEQSKD
jgi:outer membrane protein assembly factor BamE (lipoprotein component of BamABCDE complex)